MLAMLLAFAAIPSCSAFKPMTLEEVNYFEYGGYPDSQDRRDCVRQADKVLERTEPSGDMYDQTRKWMRLDLIAQCMKQRQRSALPR
ncbi:MAG: hypothetical protein WAU52_03335 [Burkholderiales bacterium]